MKTLKHLAALPLFLAALFAGQHEGESRGGLARETGVAQAAPVAFVPSPAQLNRWRTRKILDIWSEVHFGDPLPSVTDVEAFLSSGNWQAFDPDASAQTYFISGTPTLQPSPTGVLLTGRGGNYWLHCTVVLLSPDLVLTAKHCVKGLSGDTAPRIFFPWEGIRKVEPGAVYPFCQMTTADCTKNEHDLALIRLLRPYHFIPEAALDSPSGSVSGALAQGFGDSNFVLADRGLLLAGRLQTSPCKCGSGDAIESRHLCAPIDYRAMNEDPDHYMALGGHSGGPLLTAEAPHFTIIGIASAMSHGCRSHGVAENRYVNLRWDTYRTWLNDHLDGPSSADPNRTIYQPLVAVPAAHSGKTPSEGYPFLVPPNTESVIINLNHEINGYRPDPVADLELVMPAELESTCERHYGVESCIVSKPPSGAYNVFIKRIRGEAGYQLSILAVKVVTG